MCQILYGDDDPDIAQQVKVFFCMVADAAEQLDGQAQGCEGKADHAKAPRSADPEVEASGWPDDCSDRQVA